VKPVALAGGELQRHPRAKARSGPPGAHVLADLEHRQVAVEEHDVDRKAHEPGVNRPGRLDQEAVPARQPSPAEQPAHARERLVGDVAALADDLASARENDSSLHLGRDGSAALAAVTSTGWVVRTRLTGDPTPTVPA